MTDFFIYFGQNFSERALLLLKNSITIPVMKIGTVELVTLKKPCLFYADFGHDFNHDFLLSGTPFADFSHNFSDNFLHSGTSLLGLVFSIPSQETGLGEHLRNDLFCRVGHKTLTQSVSQSVTPFVYSLIVVMIALQFTPITWVVLLSRHTLVSMPLARLRPYICGMICDAGFSAHGGEIQVGFSDAD